MEEHASIKPKVDSPTVLGTLDVFSSPLTTPRGKTATQRQEKITKTPSPIFNTADGQDGHDMSPSFKLPSVVVPHSSEVPVPCNSVTSAVSQAHATHAVSQAHATRPATSCPVDMHHKAEGSESAKPPTWKSLPAIVTASSTAKDLMPTPLDRAPPKGQSQVLESKEAGKGQLTVTNKNKCAADKIACMHAIVEAHGEKLPAPAECQQQDFSRQATDSVGASLSLPHKLKHETKEAVRPPRTSLPAYMPSRGSKEKVTKHKVRQRRKVTPSTTDTSTSMDEENTCGKHVAFKAQGGDDRVNHPCIVGGSSSVPNRPKEVLPRPQRCSLPATLERSLDEEEALPSTEYISTELSA